jgi:hypothetical protein
MRLQRFQSYPTKPHHHRRVRQVLRLVGNQFKNRPLPVSAYARSRSRSPCPPHRKIPLPFFSLLPQIFQDHPTHNRWVEDGGPTTRRPLPFKSFCYRAPGPTIFYSFHRVINFRASDYGKFGIARVGGSVIALTSAKFQGDGSAVRYIFRSGNSYS